MRIGVSLTSAHTNRDVREAGRWMIARAAAAREAGLESLFVGDHHAMPVPYYQNTPLLGRLLAEWGERPAGCLFLLPLWPPVLVAEQVGTLAALHPGRFIVQCALGAGRDQFAAMGVNSRRRPSMFEESLDIVRRLLAGERVDGGERYPEIRGVAVAPLPPEPVDFWIGGSVEASIDRAARLGDGWLAGPELTFGLARHWIEYYRSRCHEYGRTPSAIAIRRDVLVAASETAAAGIVDPILAAGYRGFSADALVWGSPATVVARFREYAAMGYTDIIIRHLTDDQDAVLTSYGHLAEVRVSVADA